MLGAETQGQGKVAREGLEESPEEGAERNLTLRKNEKQEGTKNDRWRCRVRGKD